MVDGGKDDIMKLVEAYTRILSLDLSEDEKKYLAEIEKNISNACLVGDYASFRIEPSFFKDEELSKFFPEMAYNMRNFSRMHIDIYCGDFVLELLGDVCVGGGSIYKKGRGEIDGTSGEGNDNSRLAAKKFIAYVTKDNSPITRAKNNLKSVLC